MCLWRDCCRTVQGVFPRRGRSPVDGTEREEEEKKKMKSETIFIVEKDDPQALQPDRAMEAVNLVKTFAEVS